MLARWHPFWYECDRPIRVGEVGEFEFFRTIPPYVKLRDFPVFFHHGWSSDVYQQTSKLRLRILAIDHPELGSIQSIETDGLDYTLTDERRKDRKPRSRRGARDGLFQTIKCSRQK
jgi:hypothetical protein